MSNGPLTDWLSISSLCWSIFRVALVWLAFHGAGFQISRIGILRKRFGTVPTVVFGMLAYMALCTVLSLFGTLSRIALMIMILPGLATGAVLFYSRFRRFFKRFIFTRKHLLLVPPALLAGYLVITNIMLAGRPEINFNDTQVTYLVQPDRWLNEGRMSFLDETSFSAFPLVSEILLLMPSSLSSDRIDQMILGQLFNLSMTFALVLISMSILGFQRRWFSVGLISVAGCSVILLWCHFAKPDAVAIFFVTLALTVMFRQITDNRRGSDLSAFLLMGLALATKYTVYVALIPFLLMFAYVLSTQRPGWRSASQGMLVLGFFPAIFALRTAILTGSPFFPISPFGFLLRPEWRMPEVTLTYDIFNDRSSYFYPSVGFLKNIFQYFAFWNSSIFLLLGGYVLAFRKNCLKGRTITLIGIILYSIASIILFYPAWWGAKYGILLIPFSALVGLKMLVNVRHGLVAATSLAAVVYFVYASPLSPTEYWSVTFRNELLCSYVMNEWIVDSAIEFVEQQPELEATLWMNRYLPEGSTILSFYMPKRYFSNHRWITAWRYPLAARLYLENGLEDEIDILRELGVDYVILEKGNPAPFDDENRVVLFSRIGRDKLLDPVALINGYVILRFNPASGSTD